MSAAEHEPEEGECPAHAAKEYFFKELELAGVHGLWVSFCLERDEGGFTPYVSVYEPTPVCRCLLPEDVEEWACLASLAAGLIYEVLKPAIAANGLGSSELIANVWIDVNERTLEVGDVRVLMPENEGQHARCLKGIWI